MSRELKWFSIYHEHKLSWARWVSKYYDICQLQFPSWVDRKKVIIKWLYRLYCIVSHKIQCTNGKLKYILVNKMGTTLIEEYGTTTSTTSTTAAITNLLYLAGYSLCLAFLAILNNFCGTFCDAFLLTRCGDILVKQQGNRKAE